MIMDILDVSDRLESLVRRIDMFGKSTEDVKAELKDMVSDIKAEVDRHFSMMAEEHGADSELTY